MVVIDRVLFSTRSVYLSAVEALRCRKVIDRGLRLGVYTIYLE